MKPCFKCNIKKPITDFYKHPQMPDGHVNKCKECNKRDVRKNHSLRTEHYREYDKTRQRHSKSRIFRHRYSSMKQRIEGRAIRAYGVTGRDFLSYEDYCKWVTANMDKFDKLYYDWEKDGFSRKLAPSIDRIDNKKGYTVDNMRWITVSSNSLKYNK